MKQAQRVILLDGLIVLLVGALCGAPYGQSITKGWGEEAVRAWRLAHFSLADGPRRDCGLINSFRNELTFRHTPGMTLS